MSTPASSLPVAPCCLLTTLNEGQASCLRDSPRSVPSPAFCLMLYSGSTCFSRLLTEAVCFVREPFPRLPPNPKAQRGRPSSRKHPSPCSLLPGNKTFPSCASTWCNYLFASCSLSPLGWKLFKGGTTSSSSLNQPAPRT